MYISPDEKSMLIDQSETKIPVFERCGVNFNKKHNQMLQPIFQFLFICSVNISDFIAHAPGRGKTVHASSVSKKNGFQQLSREKSDFVKEGLLKRTTRKVWHSKTMHKEFTNRTHQTTIVTKKCGGGR